MTKRGLHKVFYILLLVVSTLFCETSFSQVILDSAGKRVEPNKGRQEDKLDSLYQIHSPRKAAILSAVLPGAGQVYNKKYWKVPLVYGALGTAAGIFVYNLQWYNRFRYAYTVTATNDTGNYKNVYRQLQPFVLAGDQNTLRYNRDEFRRNIDYSVLFFIALWGLNVVDATVDAHLKSFDVSPDLGLRFKGGYSEMAHTNGISLVLTFR